MGLVCLILLTILLNIHTEEVNADTAVDGFQYYGPLQENNPLTRNVRNPKRNSRTKKISVKKNKKSSDKKKGNSTKKQKGDKESAEVSSKIKQRRERKNEEKELKEKKKTGNKSKKTKTKKKEGSKKKAKDSSERKQKKESTNGASKAEGSKKKKKKEGKTNTEGSRKRKQKKEFKNDADKTSEEKKKKNKSKQMKANVLSKKMNNDRTRNQSNGRGASRQNSNDCVEVLARLSLLLGNQARNYFRQSNRAIAYKMNNERTLRNKRVFNYTLQRLKDKVGANLAQAVCSNSSLDPETPAIGTANVIETATTLENCQLEIETFCGSPLTTQEDLDVLNCNEKSNDFRLKFPELMRGAASTICDATTDPVLIGLETEVRACSPVTEIEIQAKEKRNKCVAAFAKCRNAERTTIQIIQECSSKNCSNCGTVTCPPVAGKMKFQNRIKSFQNLKTFF